MMPTYVRGVSVFISAEAKNLWNRMNEVIDELPQTVSCRESDPDAWFPDEDRPMASDYTQVKKLCRACPIQTMCLEYAITNQEQHGLWGGLTARERINLVRTQKRHKKQA